jgi:hypothetical protein
MGEWNYCICLKLKTSVTSVFDSGRKRFRKEREREKFTFPKIIDVVVKQCFFIR